MPAPRSGGGSRSSIDRLGLRARAEDMLAAGATIDEITGELNAALDAAGREERVSRSAVGRVSAAAGVLRAKRRVDRMMAAIARDAPLDAARQRELLRTLLVAAATGDDDEPADVGELKDIVSSLLRIEQAGHLEDLRVAAAERRAREAAARAGEKAARHQGLSAAGAAAIRAAIEGEAA